jgi:hypothetical protein
MREIKVETYLKDQVRERGGLCLKLIALGKNNFPDRTILAPGGKIFFVELKAEGKDLRPTQAWFKRILLRLGFKFYVCRTRKEVDDVLNKEMEAA